MQFFVHFVSNSECVSKDLGKMAVEIKLDRTGIWYTEHSSNKWYWSLYI